MLMASCCPLSRCDIPETVFRRRPLTSFAFVSHHPPSPYCIVDRIPLTHRALFELSERRGRQRDGQTRCIALDGSHEVSVTSIGFLFCPIPVCLFGCAVPLVRTRLAPVGKLSGRLISQLDCFRGRAFEDASHLSYPQPLNAFARQLFKAISFILSGRSDRPSARPPYAAARGPISFLDPLFLSPLLRTAFPSYGRLRGPYLLSAVAKDVRRFRRPSEPRSKHHIGSIPRRFRAHAVSHFEANVH
jgi:hypothetical protein